MNPQGAVPPAAHRERRGTGGFTNAVPAPGAGWASPAARQPAGRPNNSGNVQFS
ncbi:MAG: hypothetical protein AVDCRST_MAG64-2353 [uncultured Phycisphaerae bacterium]|uniref:Uncharacterized protein n=1 Tax=uncultured Phycisphaerae bacterium TaxID=904963 RepID=A0A6J4PC75_9BACT|nr:MAG: hypothetical protein AVDCRST_MAG64-2353 [uncultured Phycisphaerae bacterium]